LFVVVMQMPGSASQRAATAALVEAELRRDQVLGVFADVKAAVLAALERLRVTQSFRASMTYHHMLHYLVRG
jgi:hypothetical protein